MTLPLPLGGNRHNIGGGGNFKGGRIPVSRLCRDALVRIVTGLLMARDDR